MTANYVPTIAADVWAAVGGVGAILGVLVALYFGLRPRHPKLQAPSPTSAEQPRQPVPPASAPDFELKMNWAFPTYDDGSIGEESFLLTLVNRKHHAIHWTAAAIELEDGRNMPVMNHFLAPGMGLPQTIAAQMSGQTLLAVQAVREAGVDLATPLRGRATLGTGDEVRTPFWTPSGRSEDAD